jgi:hypothetical protein
VLLRQHPAERIRLGQEERDGHFFAAQRRLHGSRVEQRRIARLGESRVLDAQVDQERVALPLRALELGDQPVAVCLREIRRAQLFLRA